MSNTSGNTSACTVCDWNPVMPYVCFVLSSTILSFQGVVTVALFRLAKKNSAFVLLFSSVIGEICVNLSYWFLYIESITGIQEPLQTWEYSHLNTYIIRVPGTSIWFLYVVIAWNRTHAIFFPLHYRTFWTVRLSATISVISYAASGVIAYYGTFFDDPSLLPIHNMRALCIFPANYGGQAILADSTFKAEFTSGKVTNYNAIFGYTTNLCLISYALVFIRFAIQVISKYIIRLKSDDNGSVPSTEKNGHLRLLLICFGFMVVFPEILVFVYPYATYIPASYLGMSTDMLSQLTYGSEALFLFFLSSMVKQTLPFHSYFHEKLFSHSSTKVAPVTIIRPTGKM